MNESIRPVRIGILLGLLGLLFGISWAFFLVLGHDTIHENLEKRLPVEAAHVEVPAQAPSKAHSHEKGHEHGALPAHAHAAVSAPQGHHGGDDQEASLAHGAMKAPQEHHDNPLMKTAHERLVRGHLHAMGLGLASIVISAVIGFTGASGRVKAVSSTLTGLGGLIYPVAWIIMGFRTPSLGPEGAEASVVTIAGPGIALFLIGVLTALVYTGKSVFSPSKS